MPQEINKRLCQELSLFFKALSEEPRCQIIQLLFEQEMCVCELMEFLQMSQPAVSHHLRILKEAGLVKDRRDGKWIYYSLEQDKLERFNSVYTHAIGLPLQNFIKQRPKQRADFPLCKHLEQRAEKNCQR